MVCFSLRVRADAIRAPLNFDRDVLRRRETSLAGSLGVTSFALSRLFLRARLFSSSIIYTTPYCHRFFNRYLIKHRPRCRRSRSRRVSCQPLNALFLSSFISLATTPLSRDKIQVNVLDTNCESVKTRTALSGINYLLCLMMPRFLAIPFDRTLIKR